MRDNGHLRGRALNRKPARMLQKEDFQMFDSNAVAVRRVRRTLATAATALAIVLAAVKVAVKSNWAFLL